MSEDRLHTALSYGTRISSSDEKDVSRDEETGKEMGESQTHVSLSLFFFSLFSLSLFLRPS